MPVTKVLTAGIGEMDLRGIDVYREAGGYVQWERAVERTQPAGRAGRGRKVGLARPRRRRFPDRPQVVVPCRTTDDLRYLVCNCDEAEPGTFKDHMLLEETPHLILEGMLHRRVRRSRSHHAFIYIRGEFKRGYEILRDARSRRRARPGYVGKNIFGTGYDLEVTVHRGAGAYICGEETGLLNSLEGKRGEPRLKPPFPAIEGPLRRADRRQQRRDAGLPRADPRARRGVVRRRGHRAQQGL